MCGHGRAASRSCRCCATVGLQRRPNGVARCRRALSSGLALAGDGHALDVPVTRISLASRPTSAREARDRLTSFLGSWGDEEARDNATLLLSEVITNAVRHARGGTILITLTLSQGRLVAQVQDESASVPVRRGTAGEGGGWGLELIDQLSNRWGVDQHPGDGKTVWFEIDNADLKDRSDLDT